MTRIYAYLAGLLALAGAGLAAWLRADAKKDARKDTALAAAERYAKTRKEMDDADVVGSDPDAARRWLHERGQQ